MPLDSTRFRPWLSLLRRLGQKRLLQFFAIGGLIFALAPRSRSTDKIEISRALIQSLAAADASKTEGAGLNQARVAEIEQRAIEDEILYREGVRLGLDQGDPIVRQRVIQKVLFLAEELAGASRPPSDAELAEFYSKDATRWQKPSRYRLKQVFAHERTKLEADPESWTGEAGPVSRELDADTAALKQLLGADFVKALEPLAVGTWSPPIKSVYGWHRVQIESRSLGAVAPLSEVRQEVAEVYSVKRRQDAIAKFVTQSLSRYRVVVDGKPLDRFTPGKRLAFRSQPSGED